MGRAVSSELSPTGTIELWLDGCVQGVGFRPFVYRLGKKLGLTGWVRNRSGRVEIHAHGERERLSAFRTALIDEAPPLALPRIVSCAEIPRECYDDFAILGSEAGTPDVHLPPDYFACDDCVAEMNDPRNRRHRYPFINCTQCGPRYTLIAQLPYDRAQTSMSGFRLCPACRAEYDNPLDRRFHAEPLACPVCGPQLSYVDDSRRVDDTPSALAACIAALRAGAIVAVKGIGGYHLMCDAANTTAIHELRARKPRPHKPLAVMFPMNDDLRALRRVAQLDTESEARLREPARPIVLLRKRTGGYLLSELVAPGLDEIGAMLPYSPLHHLLLGDFGAPLVATSANLSGEPVLTDNLQAEKRLGHVADAWLHHNRPILRPADDPLYRVIAGRARPLRLGRGNAPLELELPRAVGSPRIATGSHMKNTVALAWGKRVVISPHVGELDTVRSVDTFKRVINDLQDIYQVKAEYVLCDAHPGFAGTRWADKSMLPTQRIFHHRAHASALAGEHPDVERWLTFTWDGVGFGEDGTLWGGEALLGRPGDWRRVGTLRPFRLAGGDRAGREPWRSACGLLWETGQKWKSAPHGAEMLWHLWRQRLNSPTTSAAGRLFDAAAAILGLAPHASFEAQAPMLLETAAAHAWPAPSVLLNVQLNTKGLWETDWSPLLPMLLDDTQSVAERAASFHASLAQALLSTALKLRAEHGDVGIGLTGGVFQNRLLTEHVVALLGEQGFDVRLAERVPCNDAGIAYGQIVESGYLA